MAYCISCGAELERGDEFCRKCGTRNEITDDVVSEAQVEAPEMTKEESIAFAEKLGDMYKSYERLKKEVDDNKAQLARPQPGEVKMHAAFKFFWPFLIYAVVALNVFYLIARLLGRDLVAALFFLVLAIASPIALLIIGGVSSVRKRNALNQFAIEAAQSRRKHLDELKKETAVLDTKKAKKAAELKEYASMIPAAHRNSASMSKVVILLKSGKAENFSQAIELLG